MTGITQQTSKDLAEAIESIELQRTQSESTFTKHTNKVHAIIKEVILGVIAILQIYLTLKLTK